MKRVLAAAIAVVLLVVALGAAAPLMVPAGLVREKIAERIEALTGQPVSISGKAAITLHPFVGVEVHGVRVGPAASPLMTADMVTGRLKLLPLLVGEIEIAELRLESPRLNLSVDRAGQANWSVPHTVVMAAAGDPVPGRVVMHDGLVTYDDARAGLHETLRVPDISLRWSSASGAASAAGTLEWRGAPVAFDAVVDSPLALLTSGSSPVRLSVAADPLKASFTGTALANGGDLQVEGDAAVRTQSFRQLLIWLGLPAGDGDTLGEASIAGRLKWARPALSLTDARLILDGNSADGALAANFGGPRNVDGALAFDHLDLTPYLPASLTGPWTKEPLALPLAALGDLDLRVSAADLRLGTFDLGRSAATASLRDGKLNLNLGEAQFAGGRITAALTAETAAGGLKTTVSGSIDGVAAGSALAALLGTTEIEGTGSMRFDVAASGATLDELFARATGTGKVTIADGSLAGLALDRLAAIDEDPEAMSARDGATAFTTVACTLALADGALATADLLATGDGFAISLTGRAALSDGSVAANGALSLTPAGAAASRVPFVVRGTWWSPIALPDIRRTMNQAVGGGLPAVKIGAAKPLPRPKG